MTAGLLLGLASADIPFPKPGAGGRGDGCSRSGAAASPGVPSQAEHPRHARAGSAVGWAGSEEGAALAGASGNAAET